MIKDIENRIEKLEDWIKEDGKGCKKEQAHLIKGSKERIYWHFGYLIALKDVLKLLLKGSFKPHKQDIYN